MSWNNVLAGFSNQRTRPLAPQEPSDLRGQIAQFRRIERWIERRDRKFSPHDHWHRRQVPYDPAGGYQPFDDMRWGNGWLDPADPTGTTAPAVPPAPAVAPAPSSPPATGGCVDVSSMLSTQAQAAYDSLGSKLDDVDPTTGQTLAQTLRSIASGNVDATFGSATGKQTSDILDQIVTEIADPGQIHQDNRGTCTATTVEYILATGHPAEFARLAGALAQGGSASVANGDTLTRVPDSVGPDSSNRSDIDRLMQSAFMNLDSTDGAYSDATDTFADGASGQSQTAVSTMLSDIEPGLKVTTYDSTNGPLPSNLMSQISGATAQNLDVPVSLDFSPASGPLDPSSNAHELTVTKVVGNQVYLRNPWGSQETGDPGTGPDRQVVDDGGMIVMSLSDFQARLLGASVPAAS